MKEYIITEQDLVRARILEFLIVFLPISILIVIFPSIVYEVILRDIICLLTSIGIIILLISLMYRMVKHIIKSKKSDRIFLKVNEHGIYLNDTFHDCFLSWQQIVKIEIGGKKGQILHPSSYLYLYKKNGDIVSFSLNDYISGIVPNHLISAVKNFSKRSNIIKKQNPFR